MSMPISPSAPISSISLALGLSRGSSSKSPSTSLTSMQLFAPSSSAIRNAPVSVRCGGIRPHYGGDFVSACCWRASITWAATEVDLSREIEDIAGFCSRASPPGKQHADHPRVLLANLGSQFGQDTSRHAKIDANVHYVPDPHSAAGNDKNLVLLRKLRDFLQER